MRLYLPQSKDEIWNIKHMKSFKLLCKISKLYLPQSKYEMWNIKYIKCFKLWYKIMRLYLPQGNPGGKAWVLFGGFKTQVSLFTNSLTSYRNATLRFQRLFEYKNLWLRPRSSCAGFKREGLESNYPGLCQRFTWLPLTLISRKNSQR